MDTTNPQQNDTVRPELHALLKSIEEVKAAARDREDLPLFTLCKIVAQMADKLYAPQPPIRTIVGDEPVDSQLGRLVRTVTFDKPIQVQNGDTVVLHTSLPATPAPLQPQLHPQANPPAAPQAPSISLPHPGLANLVKQTTAEAPDATLGTQALTSLSLGVHPVPPMPQQAPPTPTYLNDPYHLTVVLRVTMEKSIDHYNAIARAMLIDMITSRVHNMQNVAVVEAL